MFGREDGGDEDKTVALEGLEGRWLCHCVLILSTISLPENSGLERDMFGSKALEIVFVMKENHVE